jgi:hypothetical protein
VPAPEAAAANVVLCNNTLIHRCESEYPAAAALFASLAAEHGLVTVGVNYSEVAKKDAALTCCSVLLP